MNLASFLSLMLINAAAAHRDCRAPSQVSSDEMRSASTCAALNYTLPSSSIVIVRLALPPARRDFVVVIEPTPVS